MKYNRRKTDVQLRKPPKDNDEAINQMWYALIGTNGSGLITQFKELKEHVEGAVVTKDVCAAYHEATEKKNVKMERIVFAALGFLGFFFGDNIIGALSQFFGG